MARGVSLKDFMESFAVHGGENVARLLLMQEAYVKLEKEGRHRESIRIKELYDSILPKNIREVMSRERGNFSSYSGIIESWTNYVSDLGKRLGLGDSKS